jgi:hypothetical protein
VPSAAATTAARPGSAAAHSSSHPTCTELALVPAHPSATYTAGPDGSHMPCGPEDPTAAAATTAGRRVGRPGKRRVMVTETVVTHTASSAQWGHHPPAASVMQRRVVVQEVAACSGGASGPAPADHGSTRPAHERGRGHKPATGVETVWTTVCADDGGYDGLQGFAVLWGFRSDSICGHVEHTVPYTWIPLHSCA